MLAQKYNRALKHIYEDYSDKEIQQFWVPFIPYAFDEYSNSKIKIMIIGQEPVGWGHFDSIHFEENLLTCKKNQRKFKYLTEFNSKYFMNAENTDLKESRQSRRSPLWVFIKKVAQNFNKTDNRRSILWNNLFKITDDSETVHDMKLKALMDFNFLEDEIYAFNPNICIFTVGQYEQYLAKVLNYTSIKNMSSSYKSTIIQLHNFKKVFSVITNHPRYLQMNWYTDDFISKLNNNYSRIK